MTDKERDSVLTKVRALLARADESSNAPEAERAVAMQKALALLAKHNLEMTEVQKDEEEVIEEGVKMRHGPWARFIWRAIAQLYFCEALFVANRHYPRCFFYGTELNIKIAKEIAMWVQESLWKEGQQVKRDMGGHNRHLTSFLNTASLVIQRRVKDIIAAAAKDGIESEGSTMLVPLSTYEDAWAKAQELWPEDVRTRTTRCQITSHAGMQAGREAGERINLGRQLGSTGKGQRLLK